MREKQPGINEKDISPFSFNNCGNQPVDHYAGRKRSRNNNQGK